MESENYLHMKIAYSISATINIGDFQNVKPEYSVEMETSRETVEADRALLKSKVNQWLDEDIQEIKGA